MSAQQKEDRLFENIYLSYFPKMKRFAQEYVISEQDAENIVQDMFAELWEKREMFTCQTIRIALSVHHHQEQMPQPPAT